MIDRLGLAAASLALTLFAAGCATVAPEPSSAPADTAPAVQTVAPDAVGLENTLRWKTASEVDNFGFDVFRGSSEEGPFERLTDEPIEGAGTTDEPQFYVYVDDSIESGVEYWYYVESISMRGEREQFTPVFKAKVKYLDEG